MEATDPLLTSAQGQDSLIGKWWYSECHCYTISNDAGAFVYHEEPDDDPPRRGTLVFDGVWHSAELVLPNRNQHGHVCVRRQGDEMESRFKFATSRLYSRTYTAVADGSSLSAEQSAELETMSRFYQYLFQFTSALQLEKYIHIAFLADYAILPVIYMLGQHGHSGFAYLVILGFVLGSSWFQFSGFYFLLSDDVNPYLKHQSRRLLKPLLKVLGMPVQCLGLSRWFFEFATLAPMYTQISFTMLAVSAAEKEYIGYAHEFALRWAKRPIIGPAVGAAGLPGVLKFCVFLNMLAHFIGLRWAQNSAYLKERLSMAAESSNLLFLARAASTETSVLWVRTLSAPFTKLVLLWGKVSLLSLLFDELDQLGKLNLFLAIGSGFYALTPIVVSWTRMTKSFVSKLTLSLVSKQCQDLVCICFTLPPLVAFPLMLGIIIFHFCGILCPSHDFSVIDGCTAVANSTFNATV